MTKRLYTKNYHFPCEDGTLLGVSETLDRQGCVLTMYDKQESKLISCQLSVAAFDALCQLNYQLEFNRSEPKEETGNGVKEPDYTL